MPVAPGLDERIRAAGVRQRYAELSSDHLPDEHGERDQEADRGLVLLVLLVQLGPEAGRVGSGHERGQELRDAGRVAGVVLEEGAEMLLFELDDGQVDAYEHRGEDGG